MYEFRNAFEYNDRIINLISDFVEYMTEIIGFTQRMPMSKRNDSAFDTDLLVPREITGSLFKNIDIDDEDIPDDLAGENPFND